MVGGAIGAGAGALLGAAAAAGTAVGGSLAAGGAFAGSAAVVGGSAVAGGAAVGIGVAAGVGALVLGNILFEIERMGPGRKSSNQAQNKQIDYLQKKYNFDKKFRDRFHRKISGKGYDKKLIEQIVRILLGLD